ncbi:MAG: carbohydrate ABC transporter permease [Anaerolineae bacterium]|nr:carbohydrate ABC transporter permease [Anaerolineae bacterium]MDW8100045.1 carbohydrate ABC transporter permease [Anaerolineae bacterium]
MDRTKAPLMGLDAGSAAASTSPSSGSAVPLKPIIPPDVGRLSSGIRFQRQLHRAVASAQTYVLLTPFLLLAVVPFVIVVFTAFKTPEEIAQGAFSPPEVWRWSNFAKAWVQAHFGQYFRSSAIVVSSVVAVSTLLSVLSGYAFGRMKFPFSQFLFFVFLLGLIAPQEAYIIPLYYHLRKIGLVDTYWALILPQIGMSVCFGTFWMRGFFATVPRDLVDAARVDGCDSWNTLWRVLLPIARPAILTMVVLFFVWTWNDFLLALVLVSKEELRTLPLGLAFFQGRYARDIPLTAAGATIVALPTIVTYVLFQRQFIRGITAGAIQG